MNKTENFMGSRKGQATMEFLMTYGWALLVVLVAVGMLAYFGVYDAKSALPDMCIMFPGFTCVEQIVDSTNNQIRMNFQNGLGYPMLSTIIWVKIDGQGQVQNRNFGLGFDAKNCVTKANDIPNGGSILCGYFIAPVPNIVGERITGDINVTWNDNLGHKRNRHGSFSLTIEPGAAGAG